MTQETQGYMFGPVQMLVVGFTEANFTGEILAELRRLREADTIRLVDMMVVRKDDDGTVTAVRATDLSEGEAQEFGALVGALVGLGAGLEGDDLTTAAVRGAEELDDGHVFDDPDVWYLEEAIPDGTTAAVALFEHRWAIPLRDAIVRAGGAVLADEWIHAKDLVAIGAAAAESAKATSP